MPPDAQPTRRGGAGGPVQCAVDPRADESRSHYSDAVGQSEDVEPRPKVTSADRQLDDLVNRALRRRGPAVGKVGDDWLIAMRSLTVYMLMANGDTIPDPICTRFGPDGDELRIFRLPRRHWPRRLPMGFVESEAGR